MWQVEYSAKDGALVVHDEGLWHMAASQVMYALTTMAPQLVSSSPS